MEKENDMTQSRHLSDEEMEELMSKLYEAGCEPPMYMAYCLSRLEQETPPDNPIHHIADLFKGFRENRRNSDIVEDKALLAESKHKTLLLKIQMKGVVKPPMWRLVEVPADYNFLQLNDVIQEVTGMEHAHLWQFQKKAYDQGFLIGLSPEEEFGFGVNEVTHEADETCIYSLLHEKGDKLEYIYDFGDDWIFIVKVEDVTDRKGETPQLIKWKSDLQIIEDCGGPWSYVDLREALKPDFPKKDLKNLPLYDWYDSPKEYKDWLEKNVIDPEKINDELAEK